MSYNISAKNIVKDYDRRVLDNISFTVGNGDYIALVGDNGAGKTTLLRILSGYEKPDNGKVERSGGETLFHVSQEFITQPCRTVRQYFGQVVRQAAKLLTNLGYSQNFLDNNIDKLSGGEKRTIEIVRALAKNPDFLFLDEPENHLDYWTRSWLAGQLQNVRGGLVFVSHDQWLIDQLANQIVELENGKLHIFPGGYQNYLEKRMGRLEAELRQWSETDKEIKRTKEILKDLRIQLRRSDKKRGMYTDRKKKLERLQAEQTDRPVIDKPRIKIMNGQVDKKGGKRVVSLENLGLTFNEILFRNTNLTLLFGEKVCLIGPNGSGKSSLFRIIQGKLKPTTGEARIGVNVKSTAFSQEYLMELNPNKTPLGILQTITQLSEQKCRAILAAFLIDREKAIRPISSLSGGEKSRLRFAILFSQNPEFIMLDEPTNHLDRASWEVLVEAIKNFNGTVLLTSHDRNFIDQVSEKLWVIKNGQIKEFFGNFSQYLKK